MLLSLAEFEVREIPYLLPITSTYGCDCPATSSMFFPLSALNTPIDTPFEIAFISVYADAARGNLSDLAAPKKRAF